MDAKLFWDKVKKAISDQGKTFVWLCEQAGVSVQIMKNRLIPDCPERSKKTKGIENSNSPRIPDVRHPLYEKSEISIP